MDPKGENQGEEEILKPADILSVLADPEYFELSRNESVNKRNVGKYSNEGYREEIFYTKYCEELDVRLWLFKEQIVTFRLKWLPELGVYQRTGTETKREQLQGLPKPGYAEHVLRIWRRLKNIDMNLRFKAKYTPSELAVMFRKPGPSYVLIISENSE